MKHTPAKLLLIALFSSSFSSQAKTIIGFGMSNQSGGLAFNKDLATASANSFIAEQASVINFRYDRKQGKTNFESRLRSELRNVKPKETETFGKNGAVVWLTADIDTLRFEKEQCKTVKSSIRQGDKTDRLITGIVENTIPDLIPFSFRKTGLIKGVSYLRDLDIKKGWLGKYKLTATVCVAKLDSATH